MTTLVIIESPGKKKKLESILGPGFSVRASFGHVRDLPVRELGVDVNDFTPRYVIEDDRAKSTIKALKSAVAGASNVILATDPDREGEAIAWHLQQALGLKNYSRVTYSEVTAEAVNKAMASPRSIDLALVRAQEGRRVLDRLVGYLVSPVMTDRLGLRTSVGRVQTPAVRLVVERDHAIDAFRATEHYSARLSFGDWTADLLVQLPEGEEYLLDRIVADQASAERSLTVVSRKDSRARKAPPPPFTTSTLQQVALSRLGISPAATMKLAQGLYEAGAITYMRTDSPNLSADACAKMAAASHAVVTPQRMFKAKGEAQEAHEAIRPTDFDSRTIEGEGGALYSLIYWRAVASQMADCVYDVRTAALQGQTFQFVAKGRTIASPGWRAVYQEDDEDGEPDNPVPALDDGARIEALSGEVLVKKTKPPARFNQGSLIAALEKLGIGRPSTYASILSAIEKRGYVQVGAKSVLTATPFGAHLIKAVCGRFGFCDYDYTRDLESVLDEVAIGRAEYRRVVSDAHTKLVAELGGLPGAAAPAPECPKCGGAMRKRTGSKGPFFGCSSYPECKGTAPASDEDKAFHAQMTAPVTAPGTRAKAKRKGRGAGRMGSLSKAVPIKSRSV